MKLIQFTECLKPVCLASLALILFSCDDSDSPVDKPETVKVTEVRASAGFDISKRSDWKFYVANGDYNLSCTYAFQIEGKTITAVPARQADTFAFSVTSTDKSGRAIISFLPEDYLKTRMDIPHSGEPGYPNLRDQSTPEKFMLCDMLRGDYVGQASEHLSLELFHENSLLVFNTVGLPEEATVRIAQLGNQLITPLRDADDPTAYKAIILSQNKYTEVGVIVDHNGKQYGKSLASAVNHTRTNIPYPSPSVYFGHSAILKFTVELTEAGELEIKDAEHTSFSREWPIDQ